MTKPVSCSSHERVLDRRRAIREISAISAWSLIRVPTIAQCAAKNKVLIPIPSVPWPEAKRIVGEGARLSHEEKEKLRKDPARLRSFRLFNDFCLIQDRIGRWHCIGIVVENGADDRLFHAVSDRLDGHYTNLDPVPSGFSFGDNTLHMWAPCAIWKDERTALMIYGNIVTDKNGKLVESSMRVLESESKTFEAWVPQNNPAYKTQNIIFQENWCRDPEVLWDAKKHLYFMYYVVAGWKNREDENVLRVRCSRDLVNWSGPKTIMSTPPGYGQAESPYVLKKDDLYYLWVCGVDYGRMSLYISEDPLNFGHPLDNRIAEQSGHAPEIVYAEREYWMACVAIATKFGNAPGDHDLPGVYIQRVKWVEADPTSLGKIVRK